MWVVNIRKYKNIQEWILSNQTAITVTKIMTHLSHLSQIVTMINQAFNSHNANKI